VATLHKFAVVQSLISLYGEVRTGAACVGFACAEDEGFIPSILGNSPFFG